MAFAVSDVSDEIHVLTLFATKQTVGGLDKEFHNVDVLPLIEATDIVSVSNGTFMEDKVDGSCMILHIQPVTDIEALTINGKWLAMTDVVDEQRYQLLGELIRTIVVGAVGHNGRHAVCIMESTDKMVAACLGSRIWRMRIVLQVLCEELVTICKVVLA